MWNLISKIDFKTGVIITLFCMFIVFFTLYMTSGGNNKKEIKKLKVENEKLEKEKQKLEVDYKNIILQIEKDSLEVVKLNKELEQIELKLRKKKIDLNKAQYELKLIRDNYNDTKKQIDDLKENPIKRTGGGLLNSIKEKTE